MVTVVIRIVNGDGNAPTKKANRPLVVLTVVAVAVVRIKQRQNKIRG